MHTCRIPRITNKITLEIERIEQAPVFDGKLESRRISSFRSPEGSGTALVQKRMVSGCQSLYYRAVDEASVTCQSRDAAHGKILSNTCQALIAPISTWLVIWTIVEFARE